MKEPRKGSAIGLRREQRLPSLACHSCSFVFFVDPKPFQPLSPSVSSASSADQQAFPVFLRVLRVSFGPSWLRTRASEGGPGCLSVTIRHRNGRESGRKVSSKRSLGRRTAECRRRPW